MSAVNGVLSSGEPPLISWVNLVEVHYRSVRDRGHTWATERTTALEAALRPHLPTRAIMLAAAELKAVNPMALGDCFAVATAAQFGLELWTGDPEIADRASVLPCAVRDLR